MSADIVLTPTNRGFMVADFTDIYGKECSIQESSLATQEAIWLGVNDNRMHLNIELVQALLPLLHKFVDTGELRDE